MLNLPPGFALPGIVSCRRMVSPVGPRVSCNDTRTWRFDILVSNEFVASELAVIVDVLNISNRVNVRPVFEWNFVSTHGGPVRSRTRVMVETETISAKPDADYLFVIGSSNPDNPALSVGRTVNTYTNRDAQVFLLAEAASRYISEHENQRRRHTTHWENTVLLRERQGVFETNSSIAVEDGPIVTCAGMSTTLDVILAVVGRHMSAAAKRTVADILLHETIRDFSTQQPYSGVASSTTGDSELDRCLDLMQVNIEEPLAINTISTLLSVSSRSLERKFRAFLGTTPNTYYRELRLAQANNLLLNTTMSVQEIGLACGFPSGFSGLYKSFFGITPLALRKQRMRVNP